MPRAGECHGWAGTAERGAGPARGGPGGPAAAAWGSSPHGAALPSGRGWRSAHLPLRAPEVARQAGQRPTRPGAVAGPGSRWPSPPGALASSRGPRLPTAFLHSSHGRDLTLHSCWGAELLTTPLPHPRHTGRGHPGARQQQSGRPGAGRVQQAQRRPLGRGQSPSWASAAGGRGARHKGKPEPSA